MKKQELILAVHEMLKVAPNGDYKYLSLKEEFKEFDLESVFPYLVFEYFNWGLIGDKMYLSNHSFYDRILY